MADLISAQEVNADVPVRWLQVKSGFYLLRFTLCMMVAGLSSVSIKQLLLPVQVQQLAQQNASSLLSWTAFLGAAAGFLAVPLIGAISDRTIGRHGRRRPWIAAGMGIAIGGMLLLALAGTLSSLPVLLIGEVCAQIGVNTVLATVNAIIPDQVPPQQRSLFSACAGMAPNLGGVVGVVLVTQLTQTRMVAQGYLLLTILSLFCVLCFLSGLVDPPLEKNISPAFNGKAFIVDLVRPLKQRNFFCAFASRCFAYISFTTVSTYLFFALQASLHSSVQATAIVLSLFQLLSTGAIVLFSVVTGLLSRRIGKIKPFVIMGALLMSLGLFLLSGSQTERGVFVAAVLFGMGFGIYLGSDLAMVLRVISSSGAHAKDLAIMYSAISLALMIVPLMGWAILTFLPMNYAAIFGCATLSSILAAAVMIPVCIQ